MLASLPRAAWWLIALVTLLAWFAALDVRKLQHPDEGRYAEIAREMAVTGDWVTPRLSGIKYFEKPPLQYWITAAAFGIEVDEWSARLAPALGGFLAVLAVGFTVARLDSPLAGAYAALALAGCVWHVGMSHFVTLDALLTGFLTLALCAFVLAQRDGLSPREQRWWMLGVYAALAAATLTKGPVALVVAGGSLVVYTLATRDLGPWLRLHLVPGLALFFALTAPWFLLVSNANPEFARFFFIHEHFTRFLTSEHRRTGAWYYFIPVFAAGVLPWLLVWAWTLPRSWRDAAINGAGFSWAKFCLAWTAFVFVFFSLSGSKLPSYILPLFPAVAMVLGWQLARLPARTLVWLSLPLVVLTTVTLVGLAVGYDRIVARIGDLRTPVGLLEAYRPWLLSTLAIFVAGGIAAVAFFRRGTARDKSWGIVTMSLSTLVGFQVAILGHDVFRPTRSAYGIVSDAENANGGRFDANAPVFQLRMHDQTFPFYLARTTIPVAFRDELGPGLDAEPDKGILWEAVWVEKWRALPQGYALMQTSTYDELARAGLPMRVLARDPRRVLVARR